MKEFFESPLGEAIKEAGRLALFGAVSILISALLERVVTLPQDTTVVVLTFILKATDKYLHKSEIAVHGLSRF